MNSCHSDLRIFSVFFLWQVGQPVYCMALNPRRHQLICGINGAIRVHDLDDGMYFFVLVRIQDCINTCFSCLPCLHFNYVLQLILIYCFDHWKL